MQAILDQLKKQKQDHKASLEGIDIKSLNYMNRRQYVPRVKTRDELLTEIKTRQSWTGSSVGGSGYFKEPAFMKPKILNTWAQMRV